jgi:hypothetical protein
MYGTYSTRAEAETAVRELRAIFTDAPVRFVVLSPLVPGDADPRFSRWGIGEEVIR